MTLSALSDPRTPILTALPLGSSPGRGRLYHKVASTFIESFPIGNELTTDEFDEWAEQSGFLDPLSSYERRNKRSDGWKARLARRHELLRGINSAADHPRLEEEGKTCYRLVYKESKMLQVCSVFAAFTRDDTASRICSHLNTRRRYLRNLLESSNWAILPVETKVRISIALEQIDQYKEKLTLESNHFSATFNQIQDELRALAKPGSLLDGSEEQQLLQLEFAPQVPTDETLQ